MPATYTTLATTTLGSAQSSVTFSSISGAYTDLVLVIDATATTNNGVSLRFNSDSGNNYSNTYISGSGTFASSARDSNVSQIYCYWSGTSMNNKRVITIAQIQNYSNTTTNKTVLSRESAAETEVSATVGLWRSTSAITSVQVLGSNNFSAGSTFSLYGIAAA